MRVSVVIPTYNEAQSIGRVLADIPPMVAEVLVVDSDSSDGTATVAREMGAKVLREPRRGYGRACLTGLAAADAPDVVVFLDGDYSDRPAEMPLLLEPLRRGVADMVIGSRLAGERTRGALPWHAVLGNRLAASLIALLSGVHLSDLGPFRAVRYEALIALGLKESTYGWPVEMIVKGAHRGLRIVEVPVSYHPRIGSSKISGTLRGSVGAAWGILSAIVKYRFFDNSSAREEAV
jgi:glycosyltransferase involved in cell wall biosynthesis